MTRRLEGVKAEMKIIVLGAGLAGICASWALAREGHEVVVIDRHKAVARGTSFANGGHIATGDALPWTSMVFLRQLLLSFVRQGGAMRLHLRADPAQWMWLARMISSASSGSWGANAHRLLSLAALSQACFTQWLDEIADEDFDADFHVSAQGVLHIFSGRSAMKQAEQRAALMRANGVEVKVLDAPACMRTEPALTKAVQYHRVEAGLLFPSDKTGDARAFTETLGARAAKKGVKFLFNHELTGVAIEGRQIKSVLTDRREVKGDIFVLALGTDSVPFARHFGLRLPVYPVRGYSVTMETNGAHAPRLGLVDEAHRVVVSRFGGELRLAGLADIGAAGDVIPSHRADLLMRAWRELLPESADVSSAKFWIGERPMTPDSLPLLGRTPMLDNLYLNTGHGALGWTLCHASAQLTADLIARRAPLLDPTPFSLSRF